MQNAGIMEGHALMACLDFVLITSDHEYMFTMEDVGEPK